MVNAIQKILCPMDFSEVSKNALRYAFQFADNIKAEIHLLHIIEPISETMLDVPHTIPLFNQENIEKTRESLKEISEKIMNDVVGKLKHEPIIFTEVEIGSRGLTINHKAVQKSMDLVIMGTRDKEHQSWWLSSVASEVLANPTIPVLVVPQDAEYENIDRVSFATDLHGTDLLHFIRLVDLLDPLKPEYRCIHIVEDEKEKTEIKLDDFMLAINRQKDDINVTFHQLEEDDTTEGLEAFNLIYHVDLQVLVKTRRNFLQALFHRSQSKKTASYTHIPLLVMPG